MMPVVYNVEHLEYRSLELEYREIIEKLYGKDHSERKRLRHSREKILGPDVVVEYDYRYSELSLINKIGLDTWANLSIREKGMWIGYHTIDNMEQFVRNYKINIRSLPKK